VSSGAMSAEDAAACADALDEESEDSDDGELSDVQTAAPIPQTPSVCWPDSCAALAISPSKAVVRGGQGCISVPLLTYPSLSSRRLRIIEYCKLEILFVSISEHLSNIF
jgi:hypothetical protein